MVLSVFLLVTTQSVKLSSLRQAFTIELNGNAIRGSGNSLATLIKAKSIDDNLWTTFDTSTYIIDC